MRLAPAVWARGSVQVTLINRDKYNLFCKDAGQEHSAALAEALLMRSVLPNLPGNGRQVLFQIGVSGGRQRRLLKRRGERTGQKKVQAAVVPV